MNTGSPIAVVKGVKTINVTEKTGKLVGILDVNDKEDLIITCKSESQSGPVSSHS